MVIIHPPNIAAQARRVGPTLNGQIEEVAVWNLDGFGAEPDAAAAAVPEAPKKFPWAEALIVALPLSLILAWFFTPRGRR